MAKRKSNKSRSRTRKMRGGGVFDTIASFFSSKPAGTPAPTPTPSQTPAGTPAPTSGTSSGTTGVSGGYHSKDKEVKGLFNGGKSRRRRRR